MNSKENAIPHVISPKDLRRLQLVLLEMLKEIDRICKKNNIRYNISGGTLLGAARHKGFIPWDDDLDITMTRAEYMKFRDACRSELDDKRFFFQDHTTDPHYPWGYGRIRYKNTEFVRLGHEHLRMKTGIFLDVFPIDAVPDNRLLYCLHCFYCFALRKILYAEVGMKTGKNAFQRGIYAFMNLIPRRIVFFRLEKLSMKSISKRTKHVRILTFPLPRHRTHAMERDWFEELADIQFEGLAFPGTKDLDGFLTYYYGDYMQTPPPENRRSHPTARFSLPEH